MDITKKTIIELKALAYDCVVRIQNLQTDLNTINAQIEIKAKEPVVAEEPKKE